MGTQFEKCDTCGAGSFVGGMIGEDGLCSDCRAQQKTEDEGDSVEPVEEKAEDRTRELQDLRASAIGEFLAANGSPSSCSPEARGETRPPDPDPDPPVFMFASPGFVGAEPPVDEWRAWLSLPAVEQRRLLLCWAGFIATNATASIRDPAEMVQSIVSVCSELRKGILAAPAPVRQTEGDRPRRPRRERKEKEPKPGADQPGSFGKGFGK